MLFLRFACKRKAICKVRDFQRRILIPRYKTWLEPKNLDIKPKRPHGVLQHVGKNYLFFFLIMFFYHFINHNIYIAVI